MLKVKHCIHCGKEIKSKYAQKFCNASCSAKHNNKGVRRHGRTPPNCLHCGKKTKSFNSKYCSHYCRHEFQYETIHKQNILEGKVKSNSTSMIRFLTDKDGYRCKECGLEDWQGKDITLDVDHIDAVTNNNKPDNLRFLCPNCHRQTETWGNSGPNRLVKANRLVYVNTKEYISKLGTLTQRPECYLDTVEAISSNLIGPTNYK